MVLMAAGGELDPVCDALRTRGRAPVRRWQLLNARSRTTRFCGACLMDMSWTLLKQAAQAWQWRRVALHEGYEGLVRGAVFASATRAYQCAFESPRTSSCALGRSRSAAAAGA